MSDHQQLVRLWTLAEGRCFYCGCETWLPTPGQVKQPTGPDQPKRRMATREHLKSKNIGDPLTKGDDLVLACWGCNNSRARVEMRATPQEVRRRRSHPGHYGYVGLRHALAENPNYLSEGGH